MDNNNNDLFNMFGIEEPPKPVENNNPPQPKKEEIINPEPQPQPQQIKNTTEATSFVKPIPDEIMEEINTKKKDSKELLKLYIGQNYESLAYGGFSFCTFLFGASYLVYRKQYSSAFLLFILNIAISLSPLLIQSSIPLILSIIYFIIYIYFCVTFKSTYVANANAIIDRIMFQQASTEEKHEMIKKAGGIDNRAFIFYLFMMIVTSVISYFVFIKSFL